MAWLEFWLDNWHVEDNPSGTVTLSGTRTESKTYSDTVSGTVTLSGTASDLHRYPDSVSGTVTVSGTAVESHPFTDPVSGTVTLSGTRSESRTGTDSRSGTITTSGTVSASYSHSDGVSGTLTWSGSNTDQRSYTDSRAGTVTISGSRVETRVYDDGTIYVNLTLAGTLSETFHAGFPDDDRPSFLSLDAYSSTAGLSTFEHVFSLNAAASTLALDGYRSDTTLARKDVSLDETGLQLDPYATDVVLDG
jgi:hypothetical protein